MEKTRAITGDAAVVLDQAGVTFNTKTTASGNTGVTNHLQKLFSRRVSESVRALEPMSVRFNYGESIGIVGRNGSGKTTLLKVIAGTLAPTTGAVYAAADPIMLGVNAALQPTLTGRDNVYLGCLAMGMQLEQIDSKYADIVDLAGIDSAIDRPMREYSAGMASRLRFSIAASINPDILIIDEALSTGDDQFRERSRRKMDELLEDAGCVFLVSHSLPTIEETCNRAIWLDHGELLLDGTPKEVATAYRRFVQFLSKDDFAGAAKYKRRIALENPVGRIEPLASGRRSSK